MNTLWVPLHGKTPTFTFKANLNIFVYLTGAELFSKTLHPNKLTMKSLKISGALTE